MDPGFDVPTNLDECPEDVLDALAVAEAFRDVLEDCLSYTEWLSAQAAGRCDVQLFLDFVTDNQGELDAA